MTSVSTTAQPTHENLTSAQVFPPNAPSDPHAPHVTEAVVEIDASREIGPLTRLRESVGYDAIVEAGHHVLVEIGFTPRDLLPPEAAELTVPSSPTVYSAYEAGQWAYPPRDFDRWRDLIAALAAHCVERYGKEGRHRVPPRLPGLHGGE